MKYRNKKTGAIIEITGVLTGGDWEEVKTPPKTATRKRAGEKNGTIRNNG